MGNIPSNRNQLLSFAAGHANVWSSNDEQIGLTPAQAAAVQSAITGVNTAITNVAQTRTMARTATENLTNRFADLRTATSDAMSSINAYAQNAPDPGVVYQLAQIDPPRPRTPAAPPLAPPTLAVALNSSTGSLTLRWKVAQPAGVFGVVYTVRRRLGGGEFVHLGATGQKQFEDATIPAGTAELAYMVQAQRGSQTSAESVTISVRFGTGGGGLVVGESALVPTPAASPEGVRLAA